MTHTVVARDLMSRPVRRLTVHASVQGAVAFLLRHGISGAPVEDEHGRWRGVFSMNDLARAVADRLKEPGPPRSLEAREPVFPAPAPWPEELGSSQVEEVMTPTMVTVFPDAPLAEVVRAFLAFKVHHVFVIREETREVEGVITAVDVLRWLDGCPEESELLHEPGRTA